MKYKPLVAGDRVSCNLGEGIVTQVGPKRLTVLLDNGRVEHPYRHCCHYVPTPEAIEEQTEEIQANWSKVQEWQRTSPADRKWPYEIPGSDARPPLQEWDVRNHFNYEEDENE